MPASTATRGVGGRDRRLGLGALSPHLFSPAEKRQIENFNKLFALAVEWPRLTGLVRRLIKLPRKPALSPDLQSVEGLCHQEPHPSYKPSLRELLRTVRQFMKFDLDYHRLPPPAAETPEVKRAPHDHVQRHGRPGATSPSPASPPARRPAAAVSARWRRP